jgi:hypothetical protein
MLLHWPGLPVSSAGHGFELEQACTQTVKFDCWKKWQFCDMQSAPTVL